MLVKLTYDWMCWYNSTNSVQTVITAMTECLQYTQSEIRTCNLIFETSLNEPLCSQYGRDC